MNADHPRMSSVALWGENFYNDWRIRMDKFAIHGLRVNVKSLAAEAKIIRKEIRRARSPEVKNGLHSHRMTRLKPESRMAHLALAYVRGVPYKSVETNALTQPLATDLKKKLSRFAYIPDIKILEKWLKQ